MDQLYLSVAAIKKTHEQNFFPTTAKYSYQLDILLSDCVIQWRPVGLSKIFNEIAFIYNGFTKSTALTSALFFIKNSQTSNKCFFVAQCKAV